MSSSTTPYAPTFSTDPLITEAEAGGAEEAVAEAVETIAEEVGAGGVEEAEAEEEVVAHLPHNRLTTTNPAEAGDVAEVKAEDDPEVEEGALAGIRMALTGHKRALARRVRRKRTCRRSFVIIVISMGTSPSSALRPLRR